MLGTTAPRGWLLLYLARLLDYLIEHGLKIGNRTVEIGRVRILGTQLLQAGNILLQIKFGGFSLLLSRSLLP